MSNKNSATEDDIGKLHGLITRCHNMKAGQMLVVAEQLLEAGAELEEVMMVINSRDLASMQKWVEYNGVGCKVAADDEESELSKRLSDLKKKQSGKLVQFEDIRDAI
jgi:hypothetical protein